jgi:coniferyl-aldehyde dehydrogenase
VIDAPDDCAVMQEEIFGPILPLVAVESMDAAIDYVNARPRPLALYHFDHDRARTERVLERTIAGGVTINDTVLHIAQSNLPFGGVGPSGMGHYHGREGFLTFSKQKPVLYQARWSGMAMMRPPYGKLADFLVRFLTR